MSFFQDTYAYIFGSDDATNYLGGATEDEGAVSEHTAVTLAVPAAHLQKHY